MKLCKTTHPPMKISSSPGTRESAMLIGGGFKSSVAFHSNLFLKKKCIDSRHGCGEALPCLVPRYGSLYRSSNDPPLDSQLIQVPGDSLRKGGVSGD